jgi:glycosyltransferase involved in cell wall biosynthesis
VYNTAEYLEKCFATLLGQTFIDLEVIVVDDGSTDESKRILDDMATRDPRLLVLRQANAGQGAARNLALGAARGCYVAFVDSDDTVALDLLATVHDVVASDPMIDVVSFGVSFVDSKGRAVATRGPTVDKRVVVGSMDSSLFLDAMLDRNFLSVVWNKVYRREFLLKYNIRFPELRAYEDTIFSRNVALHAACIVYLKRSLYFALTRSGSTSRGMTEKSFSAAVEMLALERRLFAASLANPRLDIAFQAHAAHFLAYLLVLAAFRIDNAKLRLECLRIARAAGFPRYAGNRRALALLAPRAKAQVFLARHPRLLRAAAVAVRFLGRAPY